MAEDRETAGGGAQTGAAGSPSPSVIEQARETATRAGEAAWQTARDVGSRAGDLSGDVAGQAYDYGRRAVSAVGGQVDNPLVTLCLGVALGYAIGYLVHGADGGRDFFGRTYQRNR